MVSDVTANSKVGGCSLALDTSGPPGERPRRSDKGQGYLEHIHPPFHSAEFMKSCPLQNSIIAKPTEAMINYNLFQLCLNLYFMTAVT